MGNFLLSLVIGLLFGIIPFAYIIGRIKGIDLKKFGSGNIGATNLGRALGLKYFLAGFILDGLKGLLPVLLSRGLSLPPIYAGVGAILGHIFNPFFGFRGGKGVSTTMGVAIGLVPKSFSIALGVWIISYLATEIVSLASLIFAVSLPVASIILVEANFLEQVFIIIICAFVIYSHRANIRRLIRGKEPKTILWRRK